MTRNRAATAAAILAAVLTLPGCGGNRALPEMKYVAVLPIANVEADPGTQALCDGLTRSVTDRLSRLETESS
jgi:TolB-like protein